MLPLRPGSQLWAATPATWIGSLGTFVVALEDEHPCVLTAAHILGIKLRDPINEAIEASVPGEPRRSLGRVRRTTNVGPTTDYGLDAALIALEPDLGCTLEVNERDLLSDQYASIDRNETTRVWKAGAATDNRRGRLEPEREDQYPSPDDPPIWGACHFIEPPSITQAFSILGDSGAIVAHSNGDPLALLVGGPVRDVTGQSLCIPLVLILERLNCRLATTAEIATF